jgi:3-isopropylmalate/(R)-2-methylmalate dehydratase small subunit
VYALVDYGFRAVIAPSCSDIFYNNSLRNGLLPVRLPAATVAALRSRLAAQPGSRLVLDLPSQTVTAADGTTHRFDFDAFWKEALLKGLDEMGLTLGLEDRIAAFEARYRAEHPWLP